MESKGKLRLLLLDDDTVSRERLAQLLAVENDFELIAQCNTREEALFLIGHYDIDLVLVDFELDDDTGMLFSVDASAAGYTGNILSVAAGIGPIDIGSLEEPEGMGSSQRLGLQARLLDAIRNVVSDGIGGIPKQRMLV